MQAKIKDVVALVFIVVLAVVDGGGDEGMEVGGEEGIKVAQILVTAAGSWTSIDAHGLRLTLYYDHAADPEIVVRVLLRGSACEKPPGAWHLVLLLDTADILDPCSSCDCRFTALVSPGAHTLTARVLDENQNPLAHSQALIRLVRDRPRRAGTDFVPDEAARAAMLLDEYSKLHRRIVDVHDTAVAKRFIVVRSSHGLSNTQIEEVTGLLMAIVTRRALILDFSNDTYTGQRPVMEYDWPLDIWMESMSPFLPEGADPHDMPRIENEEYGKYGELLACAHWNDSMPSHSYLANTLFGYPTAYLNQHHASWITANFGPFVFPLLHAFLHRPSAAVRAKVDPIAQILLNSSCSVGLQIRWHHLRAYLDAWGYNHPHRTVEKFVSCAAALCPFDERTTIFVATDFKYIRDIVQEQLITQMQVREREREREREEREREREERERLKAHS
jgi:hypothetical protein